MTENTNKTINVKSLLEKAFLLFQGGDFDESITVLEKALAIEFDDLVILSALKAANFWKDRWNRLDGVTGFYERGEYLLDQWSAFKTFSLRLESADPRMIAALKQFVFGEALKAFDNVLKSSSIPDGEVLMKAGFCLKITGNYDQALDYLEQASRHKRDDPVVLSQLGDTYALIGEIRASKVFFREAFFIDPQKVILDMFDSLLIRKLIERVREIGYSDRMVREWLPVYGVVFGVLNVKRELRSLEYGKLRQSVTSLENRIKQGNEENELLIPRLINRYFWLIDHYIGIKDNRNRIEDILKKMKDLDHQVYELYTK